MTTSSICVTTQQLDFIVTNTSALSLAHALLHNWVSRFGTPEHITSDRGSQFTSTLWSQLSTLLGNELHQTTSYHPQANGMVERFHRDLKAALRARLNGPNWVDELPWVLLGLRTAPKEDLQTSAAEMVYGAPLLVPGDFVCPSDDPVAAAKLCPTPASRHGTAVSHVPNNIINADYVFIRLDAHQGPLHRIYDGPYRVIEHTDNTFVLDIGGRLETVSIDRLKCAHADPASPIMPAQPPRRGRPPRVQQAPHAITEPVQPIVPVQPRKCGRPPRVQQTPHAIAEPVQPITRYNCGDVAVLREFSNLLMKTSDSLRGGCEAVAFSAPIVICLNGPFGFASM